MTNPMPLKPMQKAVVDFAVGICGGDARRVTINVVRSEYTRYGRPKATVIIRAQGDTRAVRRVLWTFRGRTADDAEGTEQRAERYVEACRQYLESLAKVAKEE